MEWGAICTNIILFLWVISVWSLFYMVCLPVSFSRNYNWCYVGHELQIVIECTLNHVLKMICNSQLPLSAYIDTAFIICHIPLYICPWLMYFISFSELVVNLLINFILFLHPSSRYFTHFHYIYLTTCISAIFYRLLFASSFSAYISEIMLYSSSSDLIQLPSMPLGFICIGFKNGRNHLNALWIN